MMINDIVKVDQLYFKRLIDRSELREIVQNIAKKLTADLQNSNPIFISILKGAYIFTSDLLRELHFEHDIEFFKIATYDGLTSKGTANANLLFDLNQVKDRVVVIVEDIVDTGNTIEMLSHLLKENGAKAVKVCTLFLKPSEYKKEIAIDYVGMHISKEFIIGYGLDYNQKGRSLPHIYQLEN